MKRLLGIVISLLIIITVVLPLAGNEARSLDNKFGCITIETYNECSYTAPVACFNWSPQ